jgi:hypothetical protein
MPGIWSIEIHWAEHDHPASWTLAGALAARDTELEGEEAMGTGIEIGVKIGTEKQVTDDRETHLASRSYRPLGSVDNANMSVVAPKANKNEESTNEISAY